jgi:hypothetical protein
LLDHEARSGGFDPLTIATQANDHKPYYSGAVPLDIPMSGDDRRADHSARRLSALAKPKYRIELLSSLQRYSMAPVSRIETT